jgi:hypothetical protein
MECPTCHTQFKSFKGVYAEGLSGYWCPICNKAFVIPEIIKIKQRHIKQGDRFSLPSRYKRLLLGAKNRGIEVTISLEEYIEWWSIHPDVCHYCGSTLEDLNYLFKKYSKGKLSNYFSTPYLTVDRIDSSLGYSKTNIVKSCLACNILKSSVLSEAEALLICPIFIKRLKLQ